jgi:hypothetical protein
MQVEPTGQLYPSDGDEMPAVKATKKKPEKKPEKKPSKQLTVVPTHSRGRNLRASDPRAVTVSVSAGGVGGR